MVIIAAKRWGKKWGIWEESGGIRLEFRKALIFEVTKA